MPDCQESHRILRIWTRARNHLVFIGLLFDTSSRTPSLLARGVRRDFSCAPSSGRAYAIACRLPPCASCPFPLHWRIIGHPPSAPAVCGYPAPRLGVCLRKRLVPTRSRGRLFGGVVPVGKERIGHSGLFVNKK